jgi:micrococcal nuclease
MSDVQPADEPTYPVNELEIELHHVRVTSRHSALRVLVVRVLVPLCAALAVVLPATAASSETASESYRVIRVVDGDTIVLERIGKVRLIGIDTQETVDPRRPVQRFGKDASAFMRRLVDGKTVRVEYDWNRKDKYNRTLEIHRLNNPSA